MANLHFETLQNTPLSAITDAFNLAFSDYAIPFRMTDSTMLKKIKGDQIQLSLSPGCFADDKLCGFILHGIGRRLDQPIAWNGGTGVVPAQRRQGIATRLYEFILPSLRSRGFVESFLEVIDNNHKALHLYQRNGFEPIRKLRCFQGDVAVRPPPRLPGDIELKTTIEPDFGQLRAFWSWQPSFQNSEHKLLHLQNEVEVVVAYKDKMPIGYIAFESALDAGNVFQFAVDENHRNKGIGSALFAMAAAEKTVPLRVINVDASHVPSNVFLEKIGLQQTVCQIEMVGKL